MAGGGASSVATVARTGESASRLRTLLGTSFACRPGEAGWFDDAALVLSELVGNAVRHAAGELIQVRLRRTGRVLRISVQDGSPATPAPREPSLEDESGRGMVIIEALALRWGCEPRPGGKIVWAEMSC